MNFFYCRTVFQVYLASELIIRKKIENVFFLYMPNGTLSNNEKNILDGLIGNYEVISNDNSFLRLILQTLFLIKLKIKAKNSNIYFASIDDLYLRTILSNIKFDSLFTFDDGTANYLTKSIYYLDKKYSKSIEYKYYLLGNRIKTLNEVKKKIKKHYSVTRFDNIIENVEYLPLLEPLLSRNNSNKIRIILCPFFDELYLNPMEARKELEKIILKDDVIFYHPRDKNAARGSNNDLLITERYIAKLLSDGYVVELFGVANSTQFIFAFDSNVKNVILDLGEITEILKDAFEEQVLILKNIEIEQ
ncbi:hypothetical protein AYY19_08570 [Photobacterium aquimaris]|uniref:glycosyltransferase family 52 n=1 Tax=Photobacterium aquimaris TaxID=512643 RepID=UPI0007F01FBD|nr:glycosyltransferase family 52 [Photobacterium aquimaris]OBU11953.1 hypothetical protein AYY19_08570 [Photobacterium aquimaris]PSW01989.1 hypothetical protein CTM91_06865 [Photobacterium aquimaris]